jgi:hypothetical protein
MTTRNVHVIHLLIRSPKDGHVRFLLYPHEKWLNADHRPYLSLPTKKSVTDPLARFLQGTSLEEFVRLIFLEDLGLREEDYALEQEVEPAHVEMDSPTRGEPTGYTIYPVAVWVEPAQHEPLRTRVKGDWLSCEQALADPQISPTAQAVFQLLRAREDRLDQRYRQDPASEQKPEAPRRLLGEVPERPSMDALAKKWFSKKRSGVRHLTWKTLEQILDVGNHAFNLRVADPYLRYQLQGVGFTWSFFTHKDPQDVHVHGAPVVEIYGVLEGSLEVWWKPYHDRGTSAWCQRILEAGDWLEVDSLQCHLVCWSAEGKGVVFKAGPGPLAEVGRLGVKGKTPCKECPCMKPARVVELERGFREKESCSDLDKAHSSDRPPREE